MNNDPCGLYLMFDSLKLRWWWPYVSTAGVVIMICAAYALAGST